jgi:hypothetical protein
VRQLWFRDQGPVKGLQAQNTVCYM